jgi:hypothetical protein
MERDETGEGWRGMINKAVPCNSEWLVVVEGEPVDDCEWRQIIYKQYGSILSKGPSE